jgi:DTW domain-containing protein YfiP
MSKRRQTVGSRCHKCKIHLDLCFCESLLPIPHTTPITIIKHTRERFLISNTANLAQLVLTNCQIFMRGYKQDSDNYRPIKIEEHMTPLYLFPEEGRSQELNVDFVKTLKGPVQLVVPDGSWRQAKKFHRREEALSNLQMVHLAPSGPSEYLLRRQHREDGLCTYEAIIRALSLLEGPNWTKAHMNKAQFNLKMMVSRFLHSRTQFHHKVLDPTPPSN